MKNTNKKTLNKHDKCVKCGELTEYAEMDYINAKCFYIDGRGHLCQACFDHEYNYEQQKAK